MQGTPSNDHEISRRSLLGRAAAAGIAATAAGALSPEALASGEDKPEPKGRIRQSVCKWCYNKFNISVEELARNAAAIGLKSVELIGPDDWPAIRKHGLICAMAPSHPLHKGLSHVEEHDECLALIRKSVEAAAEAGFPNVITFSGNRRGLPDDAGIENCVKALKSVMGFVESKKVTLCMELLNSKVDHKDYQCDKTAWGVEVVKRVDSPRFKLLYDIYHMQIMEGDVIRTIRENHPYIGHYHTGGNPGRNEIDETQELNYAAILRAIAETGYQGYVGQEFIPTRDPMTSLRQAYRICDV
ncbi:MAG: TIM barrel protein [Planctomycetes bacterium]|nr:TIM barrel protein [Planctomycetota bacterium]